MEYDTTDHVHVWYRNIIKMVAGYGIAVIPFHGIRLQYKAHGLCLPCVGTVLYNLCGELLHDILGRTLDLTQHGLRSQKIGYTN